MTTTKKTQQAPEHAMDEKVRARGQFQCVCGKPYKTVRGLHNHIDANSYRAEKPTVEPDSGPGVLCECGALWLYGKPSAEDSAGMSHTEGSCQRIEALPGDSRLASLVRDLNIAQVEDRDLFRLDVLTDILFQAQLMIDLEVDRARKVERTWSQIAAATGMRSKQAAAMRWGKKRPAAPVQTEAMF